MNTTTCTSCGAVIEWPAKACPYCGKPVKAFRKLVACRACGNLVAKDAKKCPQCGKRTPNKALFITRTVFAVIFIIFFASCVSSLSADDTAEAPANNASVPEESPVENTPEYIEIDAVSLWTAYQENEVNADLLYGDKMLAVTGTIIDIGKDIVTEAPCISLDTGNGYGLYPIQCFFPKYGDQTELLATLSDGDVITIYGTCTGEFIINVQLSGCYLAEEEER